MTPNPNNTILSSNDNNNSTLSRTAVAQATTFIKDRPNKLPYDTKPGEKPYKLEIVWRNVILFIILHYIMYLGLFAKSGTRGTWIINIIWGVAGSWGIAGGAHRHWAHKSYKANKKLKALLVFLQTIAGQNSVIEWVRDHRVHHKYSDTNADPHNASRGFFFSHMGWLMCKKHPDVIKYGKRVDMSDVKADPWLQFQHKYYVPLVVFITLIVPVALSMFLTGEPFSSALYGSIARYMIQLHITWSINSVSHIWGAKPFEKGISPTDTYLIGTIAFGEGWHNYHHVYPWDYKVSELPRYWCNFTIPFIDFFAWLGWAYDLKTPSEEMVRRRVLRTGDGSHRYSKEEAKKKLLDAKNSNVNVVNEEEEEEERDVEHFWGWDDKDMLDEDRALVDIINPKFDTKFKM